MEDLPILILGRTVSAVDPTKSEIIIGEGERQVVITLVEVRRGYARIGVEAPLDVPVHRGEIFRKIHGEKQ